MGGAARGHAKLNGQAGEMTWTEGPKEGPVRFHPRLIQPRPPAPVTNSTGAGIVKLHFTFRRPVLCLFASPPTAAVCSAHKTPSGQQQAGLAWPGLDQTELPGGPLDFQQGCFLEGAGWDSVPHLISQLKDIPFAPRRFRHIAKRPCRSKRVPVRKQEDILFIFNDKRTILRYRRPLAVIVLVSSTCRRTL